jgi:hypothetical protein
MWSLEFGDFAEDFVGKNLDDYRESLSLCELEGDQLFCRRNGRWVDAQFNNFIEPHRLKDNRHFLRPQFIAVGPLKIFNVIQLEVGENGDSCQLSRLRDRLPKFKVFWIEAEASSRIRSRRRHDGSSSSGGSETRRAV